MIRNPRFMVLVPRAASASPDGAPKLEQIRVPCGIIDHHLENAIARQQAAKSKTHRQLGTANVACDD